MALSTYKTLLEEFLRREPDFGFIGTADSVSTTAIVSVKYFQNSRAGPGKWADLWQYRYNRTGDDRKKPGGALSVATWSHAGSNNSNTSDLEFAATGPDPDRILGWFTEAQRRQSVRTHRALTLGHDTDMELSGVSYWDGTLGGATANAAVTKVTSEGNVFSGTQAMFFNLSGAGGTTIGEVLRVNPSKQIYVAVTLRADAGTCTWSIWDSTNGAVLGSVATSSEEWVLLEQLITVPATCEGVQFLFTGTGASDDIYIDTCFGPYETGVKVYDLPSGIDRNELSMVRPSRYDQTLAAGVFTARSRSFYHDLVPHTRQKSGDYIVENFPREVVPNKINFLEHVSPSLLQRPLWLAIDRQLSDLEPITSESSTTNQPIDEVVDWALLVAYEDVSGADFAHPTWGDKYRKALGRVAADIVTAPPPPRLASPTRHSVGWN